MIMEQEDYSKIYEYESMGKVYAGEKACISLTSWKARINTVAKTLYSLIKMCHGFHIVLVLSKDEFPLMEKELPDNLMLFVENQLIELFWIRPNLKSFKKILFTMDKYRDVPVISADDDCYYIINYAEELYNEWIKDKDYCITFYTPKDNNIPITGGALTLYPPYIFNKNCIDILNKSELYLYTNQDDDFYAALRLKFNLTKIKNIKRVKSFKEIYIFHDELNPCNEELKSLTKNERLNILKQIIKIVDNL